MLEGVMTRGTGTAARSLWLQRYPAAGKTGTEHDVWFAGYSSNLLCVIWIGNDDYTDVKMQGATAAAPMWGEFMKRAQKLPQYSDMKSFVAPGRHPDRSPRQNLQPPRRRLLPRRLHRRLP